MTNDKPIHIYWFSGSGNTLAIAAEVRDKFLELGYMAKLLPMEISHPQGIDRNAVIGIIVPVAWQGTYPLVWEFLHGLPEGLDNSCFLVDTLGIYSGGILGPIKNILIRKGFKALGAKEIPMPNIFQKKKRQPERDIRLKEAGKITARRFCEDLIAGTTKWTDIPVYSWFLSLIFRYRLMVNFWKFLFPWKVDPDKCLRCGVCVSLCPERCLSLDKEKNLPVNRSNCILCQRCFSFCPSNAIYIGSKKAIPYKAYSRNELLSFLKIE